MTPADFTNELLIGWGGADVFNQALNLAQRGGVLRAEWDDVEHVISGEISGPTGYPMKIRLEVLDDGTIISHCPCRVNREYGQVCPHVVALGIHQMVTFTPDDAEDDDAGEEADGGANARHRLPEDARLVPGRPVFRMYLSGSRASLGADVFARYGEVEVPCCGEADVDAVLQQDAEDPYLYHVRNPDAEARAAALLREYGFEKERRFFCSDPRDVLSFLGSGVPYLRRQGWHIRYSERLEAMPDAMPMIVPVVTVKDAPRGSFDVGYTFDAGNFEVDPRHIQAALNRGDSYILNGAQTLLIDSEAVNAMREVFADCATTQGGAANGFFRLGGIYAPYVKSSVEALDAIDIDDTGAPNWRENAAARNRDVNAKFEPVALGALESTLRPYQKQGVYWMRFLEKSGLSGLLADEMGLGKTLQTLTWLSLRRCDPAASGKPALIVCPTSLVRNWEAEAEKFTPWMKRLVVSGPDRARVFRDIPAADLVITSYALIQRDLEAAYMEHEFSAMVLDEAQHIKNRTTRNAQAVKSVRATQKLVLTGTPVENSVSDVWSIFDFLLPDYLGEYPAFKDLVEIPVMNGGKEGAAALEKLRRKLHPFILRRLKKDVAKDLPDKIVRVAYCPMSEEQQRLTNEVRMRAKNARTKFEMLSVLMRMRQIANHPALVSKNAEPDSGKLEAFFDILDEAIGGGHRVLVFSQFVSMLSILRAELGKRNVAHCYLDGSTKDRLGECRRFNQSDIPVFLISLHAGGTGLNLTGADTVIHFDPWWNPAVEDQATDRAHRIGQKKTVCVIKLISEDSVEKRVLELQEKKQSVIDATVGATDEAIVSKMSFDDLKQIAGL
jgi:superfamily II DNA or RNA helicase